MATPNEKNAEMLALELKEALGPHFLGYRIDHDRKVCLPYEAAAGRAWIDVDQTGLLEGIKYLMTKHDMGFLTFITGVDNHKELEVLYHISEGDFPKLYCTVNFRLRVPYSEARVPTITHLIPGALWYERELQSFFGVKVEGIPDDRPIFLPEDWPAEVYPLRKEYSNEDLIRLYQEKRSSEEVIGKKVYNPPGRQEGGQKGRFILPLGPQHIILKEPVHFQFVIDGEEVVDVDFILGYNFRGMEKAIESRPYPKAHYLIERICAICDHSEASTFSYCLEELMGLEIPPRAHYLRALMMELERLQSHYLWFGIIAQDMGFDTVFHYTWRDRERINDIIEAMCGNRMRKDYNTEGGVRRDINADIAHKILEAMDYFDEQTKYYERIFTREPTAIARLKGVGIIPKEDARKLCIVGMMARGSGIRFDTRKSDPASVYPLLDWDMAVFDTCDNLARTLVRIYECYESTKIIRQILANLPAGPIRVLPPDTIPEGESLMRWEAPRGECCHYMRGNGTEVLERNRLRGPTGANINAFKTALVGDSVADIPITIRTFDHCYGCVERVTLVSAKTGRLHIYTLDELYQKRVRL